MGKYFIRELIFLIILGWLTVIVKVAARDGNPFLTHFQLPGGVSNHNLGFEQGDDNIMFVLNRKGIFTFDGLQWENLGVSGRPVSIAYTDRLFYCTDRGVGYFNQNLDGTYDQTLLLRSDENDFFYKLIKTEEGLFAISPKTICHIYSEDGIMVDTVYIQTQPGDYISGFFILEGQRFYVSNFTDIFSFPPDGAAKRVASLPRGEDITFSFIHENKFFFGSSANKIYHFDGTSLSVFTLQADNYLNINLINGGISVSPEEFIISTLNGGCVIVNSSEGNTVNILNFSNGLPDDVIYSLGMGNDGGLWISHGMGITRADLQIPVRSYNCYQGLRGSLFKFMEFSGTLYAGTSEGLYYLAGEREYRRIEVPVMTEAASQDNIQEPADKHEEEVMVEEAVDEAKEEPESGESERGFLSRLLDRIGLGKEQSSELTDEQPDGQSDEQPDGQSNEQPDGQSDEQPDGQPDGKPEDNDQSGTQPSVRIIRQLQSITYSYKPVAGVRGKVQYLVEHNGILFAATNLGLFQIQNNTAISILRGKNIIFAESALFRNDALLIGTDEGAYLASRNGNLWSIQPLLENSNSLVTSMVEIDEDRFLITTEFDLIMIMRTGENHFRSKIIHVPDIEFGSPVVRLINGKIRVFSPDSVYIFNHFTGQLVGDSSLPAEEITSVAFYQQGYTWLKKESQWIVLSSHPGPDATNVNLLNILENTNDIYVAGNGFIYAVTGHDQLYRIHQQGTDEFEQPIGILLKRIRELSGDLLSPGNIRLEYASNSLKVDISAPFYTREGSVMFQYNIPGLSERWSEWSGNPILDFPYFPPGNYIIRIRARNIFGNISEILDIPFQVKPPFWQTLWFYIIATIIVIVLFILILKLREQSLRRDKEILEEKVKERTRTIEKQNETLKQQRDNLTRYNREIMKQKGEIEIQRDQIFKQNQEITESLTYARRIQSAVMPSKEVVDHLLKSYFIIFRPRNIVSGDFYWMTRKNNKVVVVASDCTGHGVPGAFMSMMGVSFLNDIVNVAGVTQPDLILNELREKIKSTLSQTGSKDEASDGMDMAVCVFDRKGQNLQYAGAYNPMYLVRNGNLIEYRPDKMPAGIHLNEKDSFTLHEIKLMRGDRIIIFSDGFADQFGGPFGKKFKSRPFKKLIVNTSSISMEAQRKEIEDTLDKWQHANDQVDDILVIGIGLD